MRRVIRYNRPLSMMTRVRSRYRSGWNNRRTRRDIRLTEDGYAEVKRVSWRRTPATNDEKTILVDATNAIDPRASMNQSVTVEEKCCRNGCPRPCAWSCEPRDVKRTGPNVADWPLGASRVTVRERSAPLGDSSRALGDQPTPPELSRAPRCVSMVALLSRIHISVRIASLLDKEVRSVSWSGIAARKRCVLRKLRGVRFVPFSWTFFTLPAFPSSPSHI